MNQSFGDSDSSIRFSGTWSGHQVLQDPVTGPPIGFQFSNDLTAEFTWTFPQAATDVYYFGLLRSDGGRYLACIDCDPSNNPQFDTINAVNVNDDGKQLPVALYSRHFSSAGIHTLIVRNSIDPNFPNHQMTITSLVITVPNPDAPVSSSNTPQNPPSSNPPSNPPSSSQSLPQTSQSSATTSGASSSSPPSSSSNGFPSSSIFSSPSGVSSTGTNSNAATISGSASGATNSSPATTESSHSSTGAIAGGVVGGVAGVAALLVLFWFLRKRKNAGDAYQSAYPANFGPNGAARSQPQFAPMGPDSSQMAQYPGSMAAYPGAQQFQPPQQSGQTPYPAAMGAVPPGAGVYPNPYSVTTSTATSDVLSHTSEGTPSESGLTSSSHALMRAGRGTLTVTNGARPGPSAGILAVGGRVTGDVKNAQLYHQPQQPSVSSSTSNQPSSRPQGVGSTAGSESAMSPRSEGMALSPTQDQVPPAYDQLFSSSPSATAR